MRNDNSGETPDQDGNQLTPQQSEFFKRFRREAAEAMRENADQHGEFQSGLADQRRLSYEHRHRLILIALGLAGFVVPLLLEQATLQGIRRLAVYSASVFTLSAAIMLMTEFFESLLWPRLSVKAQKLFAAERDKTVVLIANQITTELTGRFTRLAPEVDEAAKTAKEGFDKASKRMERLEFWGRLLSYTALLVGMVLLLYAMQTIDWPRESDSPASRVVESEPGW